MGVTDFAERFAQKLFTVYPEWRQFAKWRQDSLELDVSVPAPIQKDEKDMLYMIVEMDGEVIVGFDVYHTHFYENFYESEDQCFADLFDFVKGLTDETYVVATTLREKDGYMLEHWEVLEASEIEHITCQILHIRSWNGTYDQDEAGSKNLKV